MIGWRRFLVLIARPFWHVDRGSTTSLRSPAPACRRRCPDTAASERPEHAIAGVGASGARRDGAARSVTSKGRWRRAAQDHDGGPLPPADQPAALLLLPSRKAAGRINA